MTTSKILEIRSSTCPRCGDREARVTIRTPVAVLNRCYVCGDETTRQFVAPLPASGAA